MLGHASSSSSSANTDILDDDIFGSADHPSQLTDIPSPVSSSKSETATTINTEKTATSPVGVDSSHSNSSQSLHLKDSSRNPTVLVVLDESSWSRAALRWILRTVLKPTDTRLLIATTIRLIPPSVRSTDGHAAWRTKVSLDQEKRLKKQIASLLHELGRSPRSPTSPRSPSSLRYEMNSPTSPTHSVSSQEAFQIDVDVERNPVSFVPRIVELESNARPRKMVVALEPDSQSWMSRWVLHGRPIDYLKQKCASSCEVTELTQQLVEKLEDHDVWSVAMM